MSPRLVGLLGHPVGHSLSPAMHEAAFAHLGLPWRYLPLDVPPDRLADAVLGLRARGFAGANVTVPHKVAVLAHVDALTEHAARIGAVNTLRIGPDGALVGDNTDAAGFLADLTAHDVAPREVLVLGGGGAARAVVVALASTGARITVCARTPRDLGAEVAAWEGRAALAARADLIVNCTPVGMAPHAHASPLPPEAPLRPGQVVYDLVYAPRRTRLLAQAEAAGARPVGGLGMLLHQGALAFEAWTGRAAPIEVMRAALEARC